MAERRTFSSAEVLAGGFEARCRDRDGSVYLWHGSCGLRFEPTTGITLLLTRPASLPQGPWLATEFGASELAEAVDGGQRPDRGRLG